MTQFRNYKIVKNFFYVHVYVHVYAYIFAELNLIYRLQPLAHKINSRTFISSLYSSICLYVCAYVYVCIYMNVCAFLRFICLLSQL